MKLKITILLFCFLPFLSFAQTASKINKMNTALLLIDIQNDYFEGGVLPLSGSLEASLQAKRILEYFRKEKLPVIHVQHVSKGQAATLFKEGGNGMVIHANVFPLADEKVISKEYPNAFKETDLQAYLIQMGIKNLIVCGMQTHMCVDASVRAAKDFGFEITLIGDACATRPLEVNGVKSTAAEVHNSFLAALNGYYSKVLSAEFFLNN